MELNKNKTVTNKMFEELNDVSSTTFAVEENVTISKNEYKDLLIAKGKVEVLENILSNLESLNFAEMNVFPNFEKSDKRLEVSLHFDDLKIKRGLQLVLEKEFRRPLELLIRELEYCTKKSAMPIETYSSNGIKSLILSEEQLEFWITKPDETMYARGRLISKLDNKVAIFVDGVPAFSTGRKL